VARDRGQGKGQVTRDKKQETRGKGQGMRNKKYG